MHISGWRRSDSPPAEIASSNLFGRANHGREFAIMEVGTLTFVIDGKVYGGELSIDQLKATLDPITKK
jgi:hypothetical protein